MSARPPEDNASSATTPIARDTRLAMMLLLLDVYAADGDDNLERPADGAIRQCVRSLFLGSRFLSSCSASVPGSHGSAFYVFWSTPMPALGFRPWALGSGITKAQSLLLAPVLNQLIVEHAKNPRQPARIVVREPGWHLEFLLNLFEGLSRHHHSRHFVPHENEIVTLVYDVCDPASDVNRTVAGNVRVDRQVAVDDSVENIDRPLDIREEHTRCLGLPWMKLRC